MRQLARQFPPRLYSKPYAQYRVREARKAAGLERHITLEACRHGSVTELGDAEIVIKDSGSVAGEILAEEVVVQGTIEGKIEAKSVCLESTARVIGEVSYCDLNVQSGAFLEATFREEASLSLATIR